MIILKALKKLKENNFFLLNQYAKYIKMQQEYIDSPKNNMKFCYYLFVVKPKYK